MAAFASSYIKTEGSAVTRSADAASMTGANFSSWYRADRGTLYAEATTPAVAGIYIFADLNSNSTTNLIRQATTSGGVTTNFVVFDSGTQTAAPSVASSLGSTRKMAGAYAVNSVQQSVDGFLGTEDTSATIPNGLTQMNIGARASGAAFILNSTIKKIAFYPERLTNAQLQSLTG
jgi:hypothetical protein